MKRILFFATGLLFVANLSSQVLPNTVDVVVDTTRATTQELVGFSMDGMGHVEFNGQKIFNDMNTFHGSTSFTSTIGFGMMPAVTGGYHFTANERTRLYVGDYRHRPCRTESRWKVLIGKYLLLCESAN